MPSLQSIQLQEQQMQQQQQPHHQQKQQQVQPQQLTFDSLPSPEELQGPMTSVGGGSDWPPPNTTNYSTASVNNNAPNNSGNQSFLSKFVTCGGMCSVDVLRPYFDVDTADILVRMRGSVRYCMVNDGFKNEVLYSDNALRLAYRDTATGGNNGGNDDAGEGGGSEGTPTATSGGGAESPSSSGKGPDLYGPIWITLTLVFFVAVTSNMSLYLHHHKTKQSIVDEGGIAAEEEWDYDINQLLHATWILYSFSTGLPALLYFVLKLAGVNNVGLVELVCLYGYSLVPFLPAAWLCVLPYGWIQWMSLTAATTLSGMLVLRNLLGPILSDLGGNS